MAELYYGGLEVTGGMAGSLFLRSIERSDRVYAAMLSGDILASCPPMKQVSIEERSAAPRLGIMLLILFWILGVLARRLRFGTDH